VGILLWELALPANVLGFFAGKASSHRILRVARGEVGYGAW